MRNHDLRRHARIHLEVKPYPCTFCHKSFARKDVRHYCSRVVSKAIDCVQALRRHQQVKGCNTFQMAFIHSPSASTPSSTPLVTPASQNFANVAPGHSIYPLGYPGGEFSPYTPSYLWPSHSNEVLQLPLSQYADALQLQSMQRAPSYSNSGLEQRRTLPGQKAAIQQPLSISEIAAQPTFSQLQYQSPRNFYNTSHPVAPHEKTLRQTSFDANSFLDFDAFRNTAQPSDSAVPPFAFTSTTSPTSHTFEAASEARRDRSRIWSGEYKHGASFAPDYHSSSFGPSPSA